MVNIQIGIDLGTTNSEVAINNCGKIELIKNMYGDEYTPSVFGIDKSSNRIVGKRAFERLYKDGSAEEFKNNKAEIKRLMGTSENVYFERINLEMNAEDISAEILKSLKSDILRKYPEFNTLSVVITVPAYFSILQSEATKRAGNLAGFKHVILLSEPIAAAISYGFMNIKNENWLIFDLGGGTFDVALISSRDGVLSVLSHNGDNFLGGKDIDWAIVDNIIIPKLQEQYFMADFNRGNDRYRSVFTKLKYVAETSKVCLSQYHTTSIEIDGIGRDDADKEIYLSFNFSREELKTLVEPLVERTIQLSKEAIRASGISAGSIEKIILVGGSTQMPYIKERLEQDLKISVDSSVDPLTVVARGACVFAISQKTPEEILDCTFLNNKEGKYTLELNYETLTSELEETISGVVKELVDVEDEYYIQFQSESGSYSGSKIKLKNGIFLDTVVLQKNNTTRFWIYLFNKAGDVIPINKDSFTITHGLSILGSPLPHSIGVAVSKRDIKSNFSSMEVFEKIFEKGSHLPLKKTEQFKTVKKLSKIESENALWIRVGEGESDIPDRNIFICELGIKGNDLTFDLPEGSDIEITIEINESRELSVTAYIPLIDLTLNARSTVRDEMLDIYPLHFKMRTVVNSEYENYL